MRPTIWHAVSVYALLTLEQITRYDPHARNLPAATMPWSKIRKRCGARSRKNIRAMDGHALAAQFDLKNLSPDFDHDPFPTYRALREYAPVKRMPDGGLFLTRYAESQFDPSWTR